MLFVVNYYAPYVSGLTDAVRIVAEALAASGRRVVVVTSRHDRDLASREQIRGVEVVRVGVWARIGKGLIAPTLPWVARRWARRAKVVNLHLPMIESGLVVAVTRGTPRVVTYQCDIALPSGAFNAFQRLVMDASCRWAIRNADAVAVSSADYACSSRLAEVLLGHPRMRVIAPPTRLQEGGVPRFRASTGPQIGFLGRLVEEKGLTYLVEGFRGLDDPEARLLIAGDYQRVAGGSVVDQVRAAIGADPRIQLLGFLPDDAVADFYASLDVFALPSTNSFEAFGIVQVEAMRLGVPALASDLPGVRVPVEITGFGRVVAPRDAHAITEGLAELINSPLDRRVGAAATSAVYSEVSTVAHYQTLFEELG